MEWSFILKGSLTLSAVSGSYVGICVQISDV